MRLLNLPGRPSTILIFLIALMIFGDATSTKAAGGGAGIMFMPMQADPQLKFTSTVQTVLVNNCSLGVTVQTANASGIATNVLANTTVNLTSPGSMTFYSDFACTNVVTSVTVLAGTSSAVFYYMPTATTSGVVTANATGYSPATQNGVTGTNPFVWTGGGGNANWNTAANWSGNGVPGAGAVVLFDGTCVSNCSPTINTSVNVYGVRLAATYAGTVTQSAGQTITTAASGWVQLGGNFVGSNSNITHGGPVQIGAGTSFTASTAITTFGSHLNMVGTFTHNSGTVVINSGGATISPGTVNYYNVTFASCGPSIFSLNSGTMNVYGTLSLSPACGIFSIDSGTIMAYGNISVTGPGGSGSALVKVAGNVAGQTISGSAGGYISNLSLEAGANNITFSGTLALVNTYTYVSAGSVTTTGSTLIFTTGTSITPGTWDYANITFGTCGGTQTLNGGTLNVRGTLIFTTGCGSSTLNSGTINAYGDISVVSQGITGSVVLNVKGNVLGQTLTGASGNSTFSNLTIEAGANPVTFSGTISSSGNYTFTSASSLTVTGSTLQLNNGGTHTTGSVDYNNVTMSGCGGSLSLNGSTMNIKGTLTLSSGCGPVAVNSGTLMVYGNVVTSGSACSGSVELKFVGASDQTLTVAAGSSLPTGNVEINTTSGAKLILAGTGTTTWNGGSQTTTVTAGAIDMNGRNLTVRSLSLNSTTVTKNAGTLTVNGSVISGTGAMFGGTVN